MIAILFGSLALGMILGVPIAICFGLSTFAVVLGMSNIPGVAIAQRLLAAVDNWPLMAIPYFIIGGALMGEGGISKRLIRLADALVGGLPGGLGVVTVVACMLFSAMSGSGPATTAAIGGITIPAMISAGYKPDFATALTCAAGCMGPIIPPSILFVTYGVVAGESIGALFIGGVVPGIVLTVVYALIVVWFSRRHGYGGTERLASKKDIWLVFREAIPALLAPLIILGGIYGGVFTPTEAGIVACAYSLIVGLFVYRELTVSRLPQIFAKAAVSSAAVLYVVATTMAFSWVMTYFGIAPSIANFLAKLSANKYVLLAIINAFLLLSGCFIDLNANIILLTPIFLPVLQQLGISPLHFGVIMVVNMCIGLITPPLGLNLYVGSGISGVSLQRLSRAVLPFIAASVVVLMALSYIPALAVWLPGLLVGSR